MNIVLLPGSESSLKLRASTRRIGLCWEATRAPRWTRIPQAWAAQVAQAGLLRDRRQSEKSQGFGDGVPESFPDQTKTRTRGKSALAFSANRRFTLNQYILTLHHFSDVDIVLDKVKSLLVPGGRIVAIEPARDWYAQSDGAVIALIRIVLALSGSWHDRKLAVPQDEASLHAYVQACLQEYTEARDRHEGPQSPHDNSAFAQRMLDTLRANFPELAFRKGNSFLHRMVGGVRGVDEARTERTAAFLRLFDEFCVRRDILHPGVFYFAGSKP